jgi:GNAT superfamily N-acetyltransferase
MNELERASAFEESLRESCAERIVPFRFGRALFNDTYPRVWELNGLRVDHPPGARAEGLVAEAERLHGEAGHDHRRVLVRSEQAGKALEPNFRAFGWQVECFLFMAYRGGGRSTRTHEVLEVDSEAHRPLREVIARREPWATDDEVVRMVLDADELFFHHGNARHFAAFAEGVVVSSAELFSDGRTAQVENVITHPSFRSRGFASATVSRSVEEALASGHDFVFLVADDLDWPKGLYAGLGFEPLGREWAFLKPPAPAGPPGTPPGGPAG